MNLAFNKVCWVNLEEWLLENVLGMIHVWVVYVVAVVLVVAEILIPDQAVEDEAKNKSTTLFSSRASGGGYSDIIEDISVAYALIGVSLSVIVVVNKAGIEGSNDSMENGQNRGSGIGELSLGDLGKSFS